MLNSIRPPRVLKRYLHWTGTLLAISGIAFVALRLNNYSSQADFSRFSGLTWTVSIGLILVYGVANTLLALAWQNLLLHFGATTSKQWVIRVYGLTQLAKYVPGNIMHLASRQAMGLAAGISGWPLAKASAWELGLIAITGALFCVLIIPQFVVFVTLPLAFLAFITVLLIIFAGLKQYVGQPFALSFFYYLVFLVISGFMFVGVLTLTMGTDTFDSLLGLLFGGAFVVAWLAGFLTPGAPAGIGVREFVLVILLRGLVTEEDLLLAALLSRMVTVSGDILFFLFALFLSYKERNLRQ